MMDGVTGPVSIAEEIRSDARDRLREAVLDLVQDTVATSGWASVRMGAVAAQVGVSRQTLHAVFGTKEALGQALVLRVTDQFLVGVAEALDRSPGRLGEAVTAAVTWTLRRADEDPMVHTVLTSSRSGGDTTMLPLLATSEPLLHRATDAVHGWICAHHPDLDDASVREVVDTVVRLVVSHTVVPVDAPEVVGRRLGRLAERELGLVPSEI